MSSALTLASVKETTSNPFDVAALTYTGRRESTYLTFNLLPSIVPICPSRHLSLRAKYEPTLSQLNPNVGVLCEAINGWVTLKTK
jgi:hypothetical protein